jgi:hypothetical protein
MPTKIVLSARGSAISSLEEGVRATMRLINASELNEVSGRYFNGIEEARAEEQAYDADARRRLRQLSEQLVGISSPLALGYYTLHLIRPEASLPMKATLVSGHSTRTGTFEGHSPRSLAS